MSEKPTFRLDESIDNDRIKQFATQLKFLPHGLIKDLEKGFSGDQSMDYYKGLIAGLAAAYSVATNEEFVKKNQVDGTIGAMLSFTCSKVVKSINDNN